MNLQTLIKSGESEVLEFKEKFDDRTVESAVAFANAKGGMNLIGVVVLARRRKNDSLNC